MSDNEMKAQGARDEVLQYRELRRLNGLLQCGVVGLLVVAIATVVLRLIAFAHTIPVMVLLILALFGLLLYVLIRLTKVEDYEKLRVTRMLTKHAADEQSTEWAAPILTDMTVVRSRWRR